MPFKVSKIAHVIDQTQDDGNSLRVLPVEGLLRDLYNNCSLTFQIVP